MKRLIILRHGEDIGDDLTQSGRDKIGRLATDIAARIGEMPRVVLSSTRKRALATAGILADVLRADIRAQDVFVSGGGVREEPPKALDAIALETADAVVVVTHLEYTEELPWHAGKRFLETDAFPRGRSLRKGQAWFIDCEAKTCVHVDA